jgi:Tfp pilus assembly protein PilF
MLEVIIEQEPGHAGAMACLADALLATFIIYDVPNEMHEGLFDMVDDLTKAALELAPKFWRAHSARALFHGCRSEYDLAQKHFHRAMELDRSNTESQTLYTLFLVKHQHASEALRLTGHLAEEQFDDALSQCIYGFHLFRAERFEDAERVFQIALGLDRNLWLAHAGAAYVYSKLGRLEEARKHAKRLEVLLDDPVHYQHWMSGLALPPEQ